MKTVTAEWNSNLHPLGRGGCQHDPHRRETAFEAMEKLNREASQLGRYAMTYRKREDG